MLKVGLIGCGFMGTMHANCYSNIENVKVTAVADVRREKAEALAAISGAEIFADGKELIDKAEVDVIDICLPTYLHAEYALAAMAQVKYLFIEKPVSLTENESGLLVKKAAESGCNVQVGQVVRFWEGYTELADYIKSGVYGKIINANFRRLSPRPDWGYEDWLLRGELSGGAAQDLHIHDIDYVLSVFGEPKEFFTVKNVRGEENSYINTIMKYEDFVVSAEGTWDLPASRPFEATFRVVFEKAVVENAGGKLAVYTADGVNYPDTDKKVLKGSVTGGNVSDLGGYFKELVYFCACAERGEKIEKATLNDAARSLKFVLAEKKKGD